MAKTKEIKVKAGTKIISFRVTDEIYMELQEIARQEKDDAGLPLNASTAARRLMNEAMKARPKKRT